MTEFFFADSSFLIKFAGVDSDAQKAKDIYSVLTSNKIIQGFQNFFISNLIIAEVFHKVQDKFGFNKANEFYLTQLKNCRIVYVNEEIVEEAIKSKLKPFCNKNTKKPPIGLVDGTNLVIMDKEKISYIIYFDAGFDNIPLIKTIKTKEDVFCNFPKQKHHRRY